MDKPTMDADLELLAANKQRWAHLPIVDKIAYLDSIKARTVATAKEWVERSVAAKGLTMDDPRAGEEWTGGPFAVLFLLRDLRTTLVRLSTGTPVLEGYDARVLPTGQVSVDVFPTSFDDAVLFSGVTAQVWMQPEVSLDDLENTTASFYRGDPHDGDVKVVLGAGNVSSIPVLDVVHSMFNDGSVVMLKMNPVNDYLGPVMETILEDLVADGFVRFAYGGADVGAYLTSHPDADSLHVTGSVSTYNAIVYGEGPAGEERRLRDEPINTKPLTAELGGVTPTIVAPGEWTNRDIRFQAEHIVSQKMHNSGFNCVGTQTLVLPAGWAHADALVDEIRRVMQDTPGRQPYYPGSSERCERFTAASENVETVGGAYPRYIVTDVPAGDSKNPWFTKEIFGPVLAVTRLHAPDVPTFLANAVDFCNNTLAGTLGANILIDPATSREHRAALDNALSELDYGCVAVNAWVGVAYALPKAAWGPSPGHSRTHIGSGVGFVHNTLMFDKPAKSVVTGPFAPAPRAFRKREFHVSPKMIYFVTNKQSHVVGEKLIDYIDRPTKVKLASIAASASRG